MKKIFFIVMITLGSHVTAVQLRNGTQANPERVAAVWQFIQNKENEMRGDLFWLWRTCRACQNNQIEECILETLNYDALYLKKMNEEVITKFTEAGIVKDGAIDKETQNIIMSSYTGTVEPKIITFTNPVATAKVKRICSIS